MRRKDLRVGFYYRVRGRPIRVVRVLDGGKVEVISPLGFVRQLGPDQIAMPALTSRDLLSEASPNMPMRSSMDRVTRETLRQWALVQLGRE